MSRKFTLEARGGILIDRLSFLKGGAEGGAVSPDEERLMQLFQNRAGLKKAYADLKDEFHLLRDRLKQQEGATIRVQEQLDALGDLLGDPKTGFGALVFYQLRTLWKTCQQQLSTFAAELTRQQEARVLAKHKVETEAAKSARLADVDQRLQQAAAEADLQRGHLAAAQNEIGRLTAFWHYFERRRRSRRSARRAQRDRPRSCGWISRHLARRTPQHQPCHHQFRRIAVRTCRRLRTRGARQGGRRAQSPRDELRHARRLRGLYAAPAASTGRRGQSEADHRCAQGEVGPPARHLRIPQQRRHRTHRGLPCARGAGRSR